MKHNDELNDSEAIHTALLNMEYDNVFTVNGRYQCRFDFAQHSSTQLFSAFEKECNSPRLSAKASILAYDNDNGENMIGMIMLNIDQDNNNWKEPTLYVKPVGSKKWKLSITILAISDIKKTILH